MGQDAWNLRKGRIWIVVGKAHAVVFVCAILVTIGAFVAGTITVLDRVEQKLNHSQLQRTADLEQMKQQFGQLDHRIEDSIKQMREEVARLSRDSGRRED